MNEDNNTNWLNNIVTGNLTWVPWQTLRDEESRKMTVTLYMAFNLKGDKVVNLVRTKRSGFVTWFAEIATTGEQKFFQESDEAMTEIEKYLYPDGDEFPWFESEYQRDNYGEGVWASKWRCQINGITLHVSRRRAKSTKEGDVYAWIVFDAEDMLGGETDNLIVARHEAEAAYRKMSGDDL